MKIYTKTGDMGTTSTVNSKRISKSDPLIAANGDVDELNSVVGILRAHNLTNELDSFLSKIQHELFDLGADISNEIEDKYITKELHVIELENQIDRLETTLNPLKNFILPGGTIDASYAHMARSICRRAERSVVRLSESMRINPHVLKYLNRLSDYFFVLARYLNSSSNKEETIYIAKR